MVKRALQITSTASMIDQFIIPDIKILISLGYKVDVASDFTSPGTITTERAEELKKYLNSIGVDVYDIGIPRAFSIKKLRQAYNKVDDLLAKNNYSLLHCHSPFGGYIARKAARSRRKSGLKVIYTAHGFHFYKGAPIKNWLLFYPVEKHYSRYTDVLVTINEGDFDRAKKKLYAGKTVKIPGVGVDTARFDPDNAANIAVGSDYKTLRHNKRSALGFSDDDFIVMSVGELNANKNHQLVINAIKDLPDVKYIIVGIGPLTEELKALALRLGVSDRVRFLGYRTDVRELLWASDCFVFPSLREGLGLAAIEALSAGLPIVATNVGGIADYASADTGFLCSGHSVQEYKNAISKIANSDCRALYSDNCRKKAKEFDISVVDKIMTDVYKECTGGFNEEG